MTYEWHTIGTTPAQAESWVRDQLEWEYEAVNRGVLRYRAHVAEANARAVQSKRAGGVIDTDVGAVMMREIVRPMIPAVRRMQEEAVTGLNTKGPNAKWWVPLLSLEADKWAVLAARSMLSGLAPEQHDVRPTTGIALNIANAAQLQREFDLWKEKENRESREAKERGEHRTNLHNLMIRSVKKIDAKAARKWMKLSTGIDRLEWSKDERLSVGMTLIQLLVTEGGGWFEIVYIRRGTGRGQITERVIRLTDHGKQFIDRFNAMTELQRPWLLPMISPPKPWRWVDGEEAEEPRREDAED